MGRRKLTADELGQLQWKINFLYHDTDLGVTAIARRLKTTIPRVNELLVEKKVWLDELSVKRQEREQPPHGTT